MKEVLTIAKKEWRGYFMSPMGYIFAGLLMVLANWLFFSDIFILGQADPRPFFNVMTFLLSIFIPAIAMGLIADEKKNSTWEVLLSLPINDEQLVMGKFLGSGLFIVFTLLLSLPTIGIVFFLGRPDLGIVFGGMIGILLLALAELAVGVFMSSLSSQPMIGFLGASMVLIVNNLMGQNVLSSRLSFWLEGIVVNLSLSGRTTNFFGGLIKITDVVFFLSWIFIFLTLTVFSLKARNK